MFNLFSSNPVNDKIKTAKLSGKFMGTDLFDMCLCGDEVKPYDRQEITYYEEKNCFLRLCRSCIEKAKKVETNFAPPPVDAAALVLLD